MENRVDNRYSKKALQALSKVLQAHRALVWINPATNNIDVKRVSDRAEGVQKPPAGVAFA